MNVSQIELPAGYEPTVTGDLPIRDGWIYVGLKPVEGSRVIGLNYYDEVNKTQVCEREMVVDKDATYVNTNDIPTIEGYEFISVGDLAINDGWVYVGVKPIETKVVGLNFFDEANYEQVCETYVEVPYDAIHLNTSKIELPDGYEFTTVGDLAINDGWIYVGVKCVKTLRIYWAIDNGDAADFADGSADTWTQELTWKHIHDEIALPQITVADGYVFNGWSVSGQNGEFWGPELKTMTVGDKFVADEKGGVISITANIVTREAGQGGSTGGNDGGSTGSSEQSGATAAAASAGNDTVVKTAAPADNSVKILPQTGFTAEAPAVFGGMLFAAMAGAGAYLFAMRKKLNETF
ncbi:MAG TPA: LPXTG cell wall anchor domain-containing protein [Candidatus Gemmiger excrementavium]|uniref:LPXTG cell wall anchor domain-containing protein n=1 Tax=Candidatus Gemmiger excrementavium TaxID=2838608 RepID=A0A9D2JH94_9FIRM|nr:LPXTG cell wall anchor domain-containing protein [Candidatus Gemmiger excrementavium]